MGNYKIERRRDEKYYKEVAVTRNGEKTRYHVDLFRTHRIEGGEVKASDWVVNWGSYGDTPSEDTKVFGEAIEEAVKWCNELNK